MLCRPVANNVNTFSLKEKWCVTLNLFYLLSSISFSETDNPRFYTWRLAFSNNAIRKTVVRWVDIVIKMQNNLIK